MTTNPWSAERRPLDHEQGRARATVGVVSGVGLHAHTVPDPPAPPPTPPLPVRDPPSPLPRPPDVPLPPLGDPPIDPPQSSRQR
jgi:hypothetical protein